MKKQLQQFFTYILVIGWEGDTRTRFQKNMSQNNSAFAVLTNNNLLHSIASQFTRSPCSDHDSCEVNLRWKENENKKCPIHKWGCVSIKWGEFRNGDSLIEAGIGESVSDLLIKLEKFRQQIHFTKRAFIHAASNHLLEVIKWLHANKIQGCTGKRVARINLCIFRTFFL
jgi:hypothetical protein